MNYFWDDQFHLYRSKNPGEFSYSDGAEVEERLLSIVSNTSDRSTFSLELAISIHDWPTEYHFSRLRHCLVRPLNIQPAESVLELGCGCGAITRFLGELGANVVAVEGSLLRARVAAERCRELTNVRVIVDDLLRFETDELFDSILLVGVLEYAALFSDSEKPFEDYLRTVTRFLAPGGRVVVAIENKVGLKYFNGCAEDHVGLPFFGAQDLYGPRTVRTFGRQELIALLSAVGLSEVQFYYPFPDYKLPSVLLSESALTAPGFDAVDLLTRCQARDYTGSPYRSFDEALAFSALHANGLLSELTNSFLVVATPKEGPQHHAAELAFAWSVNRAPGFCTQTSFGRRGAEIQVVKKLLAPSADGPHEVSDSLTITHHVEDSAYSPGQQLFWNLLRARARSGDLDSIVQALRPWMEFLLRQARIAAVSIDDVLEKPPKLGSYVLSGDLVDCTPFNLLKIDDDLVPIDMEWHSRADTSLGWVITRGVLWSMPCGMSSGRTSPSLLDIIHGLCDFFALEVSETEVENWLDLEEDFQRVVTGLPCEPLTVDRTFCGMVPFASEISSLKETLARGLIQLAQKDARIRELEQTLVAHKVVISNLRNMVADRDKNLRNMVADRDKHVGSLILEKDQLGNDLSRLRAEDSALKIDLTKRSEELNSVLRSRAWKLTSPLRALGRLRSGSHAELHQLKKDRQLISQSGLFDAAWYLSQNPDVAQQGLDPLDHYIHHGGVEGRDPGRDFSSNWYLEQNPDVRTAGFNPLIHYLRFGAAEGRKPLPTGKSSPKRSLADAQADAQKDWDDSGHNRLRELLDSDERITFPETDNPTISIILVFYNKAHLSLMCLDSILDNADVPYEVLIVDNQSSDETNLLLERLDGTNIIKNPSNLGFGDACMQGADQARGEYLCFLNNDTLLQPHALSSALISFRESSDVGLVGGKILLANGDLQEAGSIIWSDGSALGYGRGDNPNLPQYEFRRPVDYCSGAFLITPRSLFHELGGFSKLFSPAYYEDSDYCMQVLAAGFSVIYEPRSVIRHYESASSGGNEAAKPAMAANQQKFREKWMNELARHLPYSRANIQSARTSASIKGLRVLYIDDRIPHRHMGSGFPRSNEILHHLVRLGCRVTCSTFTFHFLDDEYCDIPRDVELLDGVSQREQLFQEYVPQSDIVWISRPHNLEAFLRERLDGDSPGRARVVYDAEAIFAERDFLQAQTLGSDISPTVKSASLDRELTLAKAADAVVVVSERDREIMAAGGVRNVFVIGHRIRVNLTTATFDGRRTFLFVGAMHGSDSPNADSMRYFCSSIWPAVRRATGAELVIAGFDTDKALGDTPVEGVRILGSQDDLTSLYNEARVFVVPTRYAAGIPYKAHEAASFGVPLVVSSLIGKQLGWQHGSDCLIAGTADAFAEACCLLYQDPSLWEQLRSNALSHVVNDLSGEAFGSAIASVTANMQGITRLRQLLQGDERLTCPTVENPAVSVVLVLHDSAQLSLLSLESVIAIADVSYELIVVDNASSDETGLLLDRLQGAKIIHNEANIGFGPACMQAAECAAGEYLCFLNNDVQLNTAAISAVLVNFVNPRVGAVGGKVLLADGALQEAGSILWSDGSTLEYGLGDAPQSPQYNFRRPVDYCSAVFLVTPRQLFAEVGGFSSEFAHSHYEVVDYCMTLWQRGLKVIYEPLAVIRHYESAASGGNEFAQARMAEHKKKFSLKWNTELRRHYAPDWSHLCAARTTVNATGLRILYIDDKVPHRILGTGFPRSNDILTCLVALGHHVTCSTFTFPLLHDEYCDIPREVELFDGLRNRATLIRDYLRQSDVVWVSRPHNLQVLLTEGLPEPTARNFTLIYDAEAIFSDRTRQQSALEGSETEAILPYDEFALARSADVVVVVSESDKTRMLQAGVRSAHVVGFRLCPAATASVFAERRTFLFVGGVHGWDNPNADSMRYFCREVWPAVRKATGAEFIVAGYGTDEVLGDLSSSTVHILGAQDDLRPLYESARVFVVPTRYAAGLPFKAYEAAAFGVPLVVSGLIARQMKWRDGIDYLVAHDANTFAQQCSRLYSDEGLWGTLRANASGRVIHELSPGSFRKRVRSVLSQVASMQHANRVTMAKHDSENNPK